MYLLNNNNDDGGDDCIEILTSDSVSVSVIVDVDYRSRSSTGRRRTSAKNSHYIVRTSSSVRSVCATWPSSTWLTASSASSRARTWWASTSRRSWNSGDAEATASTAELCVCCRPSASNASLPRRRLPYHWRPSTEPCDVIPWRHRRPLTAAAGLPRDWFILIQWFLTFIASCIHTYNWSMLSKPRVHLWLMRFTLCRATHSAN